MTGTPGTSRETEGDMSKSRDAINGGGILDPQGRASEVELQAQGSRTTDWPDEVSDEGLDVRWPASRLIPADHSIKAFLAMQIRAGL